MHNYTYSYYDSTNRLQRVTGSGDRYVYDANGNVQHDLDSSVGFTIYDMHNLPVSVYTTGGVCGGIITTTTGTACANIRVRTPITSMASMGGRK